MLSFQFVDAAPSYCTSDDFYVRIDPKICQTDELIKSLYYLVWFPGYFGFNWNALYDFLRDLEWIPCRNIIFFHEVLPKIPEKDLKIYLEILHDSIIDWGDNGEHEIKVFFKNQDKEIIEGILKQ